MKLLILIHDLKSSKIFLLALVYVSLVLVMARFDPLFKRFLDTLRSKSLNFSSLQKVIKTGLICTLLKQYQKYINIII